MLKVTLDLLTEACTLGGASVLVSTTELAPAAGELAGVAPARYVDVRGNGTYVYETRSVDGEPVATVLIDGKASSLNRLEEQLSRAISDGAEPLAKTPRAVVTYGDRRFADYDLPHRIFDGHLRAGTIDGVPTTDHEKYRGLRNSTAANFSELLQTAPASLVLGCWDSTRRANQIRIRSAAVGEIIGVLSDQSPDAVRNPPRGGSRIDPVAAAVHLDNQAAEALVAAQEDELSVRTVEKQRKEIKAKGTFSGSNLGLGNVPPGLDSLGQVSCSRIVRHFSLSFAALRQLRFGAGPKGDAACRALLAAWVLNGMVRSQSELLLRANCDLVEKGEPELWLDGRYGKRIDLATPSIPEADELLDAAIHQAAELAGIRWEGQVLEVAGNPTVLGGAVAAGEDED